MIICFAHHNGANMFRDCARERPGGQEFGVYVNQADAFKRGDCQRSGQAQDHPILLGTTIRYTTKAGNNDFFGTIQFALIQGGGANGAANTITRPLGYVLSQQSDDDAIAIAAELVEIGPGPRINALHAIKSAHLGNTNSETTVDLYG